MSTFRTVNCEKHGDYQAKITEAGSGRFMKEFVTSCPKREEELKSSYCELIESHKKNTIKNTFEKVNIPKRYKLEHISNIKPMNDSQAKIINRCELYVDKYDTLKELGTSLIFTGKPGTGKTLISLSMIKPIIEQTINKIFKSFIEDVEIEKFHPSDLISADLNLFDADFKYVNTYDLFMEIKSTYNKNSNLTEKEILYKYTSSEILIIDEIGAQSGSDYEITTMFRIINSRYENMKPTFLISNLSEEDLSKYIGERTIDRFYENHGAVFVFDWESHRRI